MPRYLIICDLNCGWRHWSGVQCRTDDNALNVCRRIARDEPAVAAVKLLRQRGEHFRRIATFLNTNEQIEHHDPAPIHV